MVRAISKPVKVVKGWMAKLIKVVKGWMDKPMMKAVKVWVSYFWYILVIIVRRYRKFSYSH